MKSIYLLTMLCGLFATGIAIASDCPPTPYDEIGPFYRPNAPVRSSVGEGYLLSGRVLSTADCRPLAGARIEFWLVGPTGEYGDAYRATVFSAADGSYRFQCAPPPPYVGRPPHIHFMVTVDGYERLISQHYPRSEESEAVMDLVLEPP